MDNSRLTPEQAVERILATARAAGAAQADALYAEDESLSLDVFEGRVKSLERSDSVGVGIRVLVDGRPGYSFTERLSAEAVDRAARDAVDLSRFTEPLPVELPSDSPEPSVDLGIWSESVQGFSPDAMLALLLEAESAAREADSRVENIPHLGCTRSVSRSVLGNSRGILRKRLSGSVSMGVGVLAREGAISKMGWDGLAQRVAGNFAPTEMARTACTRATSLLGAAPIASGPIPILFDKHVAGSFLSLFLGAFMADSVQKGQSRLAGRIGERIAASGFSLRTEPHLRGMSGSRTTDGEGIPTAPRALIQDGVLQGFLHNIETATRDGIAPTGDAARGYSGRVGASFGNAVVPLEGGLPHEALLRRHPRLLHVVKLDGSSGCNGISGEISIGVQGFLVENGAVVQPVDRVTLSGNFYEMLQSIDATGDSWKHGVQSLLVPSILVGGLTVAS